MAQMKIPLCITVQLLNRAVTNNLHVLMEDALTKYKIATMCLFVSSMHYFFRVGCAIMIMTAEMVLTKEKNVMLNIKHVLLKSLLVKISNVSVTNIDAMAKTIAVIILMKSDAVSYFNIFTLFQGIFKLSFFRKRK
jgi:hypothetical protein